MQRRKRMGIFTEGKSLMKNYAIEETSKLAIKRYCGKKRKFSSEWDVRVILCDSEESSTSSLP